MTEDELTATRRRRGYWLRLAREHANMDQNSVAKQLGMSAKSGTSILAIVAVVVIVGIAIAMSGDGGSSGTDPAPAQQNSGSAYLDSYGGSADVYSQIATSRDCDYLQDEFDTASAGNDTAEPGSAKHKWTTGYMMAADDRMREVGCY